MEQLQAVLLAEIIEQVLDRIEYRLSKLNDKQLADHEFVELKSLFKEDTVSKALHIVDTYSIISYRPESGISEVIELTEAEWSPKSYKLFPDTNFCHCKFFNDHILNATEKTYYTCRHVLAVRLARILNRIKVEVLPKNKFNSVLKEIVRDATKMNKM